MRPYALVNKSRCCLKVTRGTSPNWSCLKFDRQKKFHVRAIRVAIISFFLVILLFCLSFPCLQENHSGRNSVFSRKNPFSTPRSFVQSFSGPLQFFFGFFRFSDFCQRSETPDGRDGRTGALKNWPKKIGICSTTTDFIFFLLTTPLLKCLPLVGLT